MKKAIALILAIFLLAGTLSGCKNAKNEKDKISIVTTIFPEYDWVKNIMGENSKNADITMLLDNGVDLHSFQPTADDIITISNCDLFIYVGGTSDTWVNDALKEAVNKDMIVIDLLDVLGSFAKEEEVVEGMEAEEEEENDEDEVEYDEHIWLSLKNSKVFVEAISNAIIEIDPNNEETYKENTASYVKKITELDNKYKETIDNSDKKTLLFADRFPFRYLVDDYGLSYFAAFVGCSAESEASFETVSFLANKIDELELHTVLILEGNNKKIANTVISTSKSKNVEILSIDSMQSSTSKDREKGISYISIMKKNLEVLSKALK